MSDQTDRGTWICDACEGEFTAGSQNADVVDLGWASGLWFCDSCAADHPGDKMLERVGFRDAAGVMIRAPKK